MNKINNKKALIFSISLIFIAIGAFVLLFTAVSKLEKSTDPLRTIGERALEILQANAESEKLFFYIDESAKISADDAFKRLAETAGIVDTACGTIEDSGQKYVYWNTASKNCFEVNFYDVYQTYFNSKLNKYLRILNQNIPMNNYELFIKDSEELSGIAIQPVQFNIMSPKETAKAGIIISSLVTRDIDPAVTGTYTVKPSFTIPFKKDFSSLNLVKQFAKDVLDDAKGCKDKSKTAATDCVQNFIKQHNLNVNSVKQSGKDVFLFDIAGKFPIKIALSIPIKEEQPPAEATPTA